jgi:hypothetical protein
MVGRLELDPDEQRQKDGGGQRQPHDQGGVKPVVLVALVEYRLQRREADRHGCDAKPVAVLEQRKPHRLALERQPQNHDHADAWNQIDEEDILPAIGFGQIPADCRPDRGRESRG